MPKWPSNSSATNESNSGDDHLQLARESLRELLEDPRVPESVREELAGDYQQLELLLRKLEQEEIHIAVFGRVSVGKSALLNALLAQTRFATSPLHGETREVAMGQWSEYRDGNVLLMDTPGINEVEGEARERLAAEVAGRADLVLFVVDGDLTATERNALQLLEDRHLPVLLIFNKIDRYTLQQQQEIVESLQRHTSGLVNEEDIVTASADPSRQIIIHVAEDGSETETTRQPEVDVEAVRTRLWQILEKEGKSLAAVNATLFASDIGDQIGARIMQAKHHLGAQMIRTYCIAKGVAVALNPIPIADLVAAAVVDASMIVHLSRLYGLPLNRSEAKELVMVIGAQMALLMGTVWLVNLLSSALKFGTGGLSAVLTGTAQGVLAYYSTYIVGQVAERYLAQGKSWGEGGPKLVVTEILDSIDRDTLLAEAKADIRQRLKKQA
ncbi:MAG: GTP-binding protein [Gammaproteobacteria bacterium]|nr:GTP-binding protein [Gammaproteobacteria bacterium]